MPTSSVASENASASPLVNTLVESLTERIYAGRYAGPEGFPAERELVDEFGVSRNAVRRALDVLEERQLIIRAPRCRTVVRQPERASNRIPPESRNLPETRRRTLGFSIWPGARDPGTSAVVQGVYNVLDHSNYRLVMGHVCWDSWEAVQQSERQFLDQMADDADIAGILLWHQSGHETLATLQRVRSAGIPIVFLDRLPPETFGADFVGVENELSAEEVVRHLIKMGHRSIAHITNLDSASTVAQRMAGYRHALQAARIPFRPELIVPATESSNEEVPIVYSGLIKQLFSVSDPPTAVFAVNDVIADRFVAALRAAGRRVPDDVAVAGFDGLERWSNHPPFLTTVHQPFEQLGEVATRLLLRRIERGDNRTYQHILLNAPLHVHGSTNLVRR
jgi:DNA-binding LacI/PurR family transcriptional regulator